MVGFLALSRSRYKRRIGSGQLVSSQTSSSTTTAPSNASGFPLAKSIHRLIGTAYDSIFGLTNEFCILDEDGLHNDFFEGQAVDGKPLTEVLDFEHSCLAELNYLLPAVQNIFPVTIPRKCSGSTQAALVMISTGCDCPRFLAGIILTKTGAGGGRPTRDSIPAVSPTPSRNPSCLSPIVPSSPRQSKDSHRAMSFRSSSLSIPESTASPKTKSPPETFWDSYTFGGEALWNSESSTGSRDSRLRFVIPDASDPPLERDHSICSTLAYTISSPPTLQDGLVMVDRVSVCSSVFPGIQDSLRYPARSEVASQTLTIETAEIGVNTDERHMCAKPPLPPIHASSKTNGRQSPLSDLQWKQTTREDLQRMDGIWMSRDTKVQEWLRCLHIDVNTLQVIDGTGRIIKLIVKNNAVILEGGVLTIKGDNLKRHGKSGIGVTFDRVECSGLPYVSKGDAPLEVAGASDFFFNLQQHNPR